MSNFASDSCWICWSWVRLREKAFFSPCRNKKVSGLFTGWVLRVNYMFINLLPVVTGWEHIELQQTVSGVGHDCAKKYLSSFPRCQLSKKRQTWLSIVAFCSRGRLVPPEKESQIRSAGTSHFLWTGRMCLPCAISFISSVSCPGEEWIITF